jgi:hypothetical protein
MEEESEEFRHICQRNLYAIRQLPLIDEEDAWTPNDEGCKIVGVEDIEEVKEVDEDECQEVDDVEEKEEEIRGQTVLYTYDSSPHIEFVLRNAIVRLPRWSHVILCGTKNIDFIQTLCSRIKVRIKIINTGHTSLKPIEYSRFLLSPSFWTLFTGPRILLYDEYSFIGPIKDQSVDFAGHSGLTLRNPKTMLACLRYKRGDVREDLFFRETITKYELGRIGTESLGMWKPWTFDTMGHWKDPIMRLIGKRFDLNANIVVYVLCHNKKRLAEAIPLYAPYKWARPILMKYQNATFENAFWPQMLEIRDEWIFAEFVGTISFTAIRKINLALINRRIVEGYYTNMSHAYFNDTTRYVLSNTSDHPNFTKIWKDLLETLNIPDIIEAWCNYFICKPQLMEEFIEWHRVVLSPAVLSHPLIYGRSEYKGALTEADLIKLWGKPYYPMVPFIMERMNRAFFIGK